MAEYVWLDSLFFKNTVTLLHFGSNRVLSDYIYNNYLSDIREYIGRIEGMILRRMDNRVGETVELYALLHKLSSSIWMSDAEESLKAIIRYLENNPDLMISDSYLKEIREYRLSFYGKTRFSEESIKKYKQFNSARHTWGEEQSKIFVYKALIPYFEEKSRNIFFVQYLTWLENPENFFQTTKSEKVYIASEEQKDTMKRIVDAYVSRCEKKYIKEDFAQLIIEIFSTLRIFTPIEEISLENIRNELKGFFIGICFAKINSIDFINSIEDPIEEAVQDTLDAYLYIHKLRNWGWSICKKHTGFWAQTLHYLQQRLYSRYQNINEGEIKQIASDLSEYAQNKYHTYISPSASISSSVYMKENCYIGENVTIKDNVFLSNCEIGNNTIIESNTIIDTNLTVIIENITVPKNTVITGHTNVLIKA